VYHEASCSLLVVPKLKTRGAVPSQGRYLMLSQHSKFVRTVLFCSYSMLVRITKLLHNNIEISVIESNYIGSFVAEKLLL
jgi:hypothetical protein